MGLPLCVLQGCISYYTCVQFACMYGFRVVGSFVCACTLVLRVIVCAFAVVCCLVAFHITRVRR